MPLVRIDPKQTEDRLRIVVIGTGTGVGKTHLGVALVHALATSGERVIGLKPIESGVGSDAGESPTDAAQLAAVSTFHVKRPQPYAFPDPISPHLAARKMGTTIDLAVVAAWVSEHDAPWTIIETAGALLSPVGPGLTNLDLAASLRPDALLLAGLDRLGILHDVSAAMLALRTLAPQLPSPIVVLQAPPTEDASTGTNGAELLTLGIASQVITFPRAEPTSSQLPVGQLIEQLRQRAG